MKHFSLLHQLSVGGILFCTLLILGAFYFLRPSAAAPATPTPQVNPDEAETAEVERAIRMAVDLQAQGMAVFELYENIIEGILVSTDGDWAIAWMTPQDPDTGEIVPTEPGLVIAQRVNGTWQVYLPSNPDWVEAMRGVPETLISIDSKLIWLQEADIQVQAAPAAALTGFRLPFPGGDTRRLTQSVGHDRYTPSGNAHFSFDFATAYPSTLFEVAAAKSGTVYMARWTQANNSTAEPGNYIVLQDTSTNPTSYQLYLHLAQDSIPPELRVIGTPVRRGQFIGMADDTGVSSGHHLHFMVHTTPTSYWGRSVDIVFEDVSVNGGRPRISSDFSYCNSDDVCETSQIDYRSNNFMFPDPHPPEGNIGMPAVGTQVLEPSVHVEGGAWDAGSGIYTAQFMANYRGFWEPIGETFNTSLFEMDWDMCAAGVPDGPVSLALQIRDKALNQASGLPGLTHFTKNYTCPQEPICEPGASQVAVFSGKDFKGSCVVLGTGSFTTGSALGDVGADAAASIRVGANVKATLFMDTGLKGRAETFIDDDSNLNDNRIGRNTVSSVRVQLLTATPVVPVPVWPPNGHSFDAQAPVSLSWSDGGGSTLFKARLLQNGVTLQTLDWQSEVYWHAGELAAGSYTWQVRSRSGISDSAWSTANAFSIQDNGGAPSIPNVEAPFEDTLENSSGWTASEGWIHSTSGNHTAGGDKSWHYAPSSTSYDTGLTNGGFLTSPSITLPAGENYYLRFWYQAATESIEPHWDQRWVQISADDGPFENILQLHGDMPNTWLRSPAISLLPYAGKTIRFRFYFITLDAALNNFAGWFIDDISVTTTAPPACADANNNTTNATSIAYGGVANGVICPGGDVDFYKFNASAGDTIGAWTIAKVIGSPLDTYLTLYDSDGRSVLMRNDDMVLFERTDSWINFQLPHDGTYYLKINSWDHPTSGDASMVYSLRLVRDSQDPNASFIYPAPSGSIHRANVILRLNASDGQSGISRVRFLWHSNDWLASQWISLGDDWDGTDGWNIAFDASQANIFGGAIFARAYDWAGNSREIGVWQLNPASIYLPLVVR